MASTPKRGTSPLPFSPKAYLTPAKRTDKKHFADAVSSSPAISFTKAKRDVQTPGFQTPEPGKYNISPPPDTSPCFSFSKAARPALGVTSYSPGPVYDVVPKTAADAIAHAVPKGPRFHTSYLSKSPGPGDHFVNDEQTRASPPRYSFGQKTSDKVFYSKLLNKAQTNTPGAIYDVEEAEKRVFERSPTPKIGTSKRSNMLSDTSPGPAAYSPEKIRILQNEPKATFGKEARENTKFYTDSLANTRGTASPGPYLFPTVDFISEKEASPQYSFSKDERVKEDRHRIAVGPGQYNQSKQSFAPAFSMGSKEPEAKHAIACGTRKIRFLAKELAQDTLGFESPGPRYKHKEFVGAEGPKLSIPKAGRDVTEDPSSKMYMGFNHSQSSSLLSKDSPGPIYNVRDSLTPTNLKKQPSPSRIVKRVVERKPIESPGPGAYNVDTGYQLSSKYKNPKAGTAFGKPAANSNRASFVLTSPSPGPAYNPHVEVFEKKGAGFGKLQ